MQELATVLLFGKLRSPESLSIQVPDLFCYSCTAGCEVSLSVRLEICSLEDKWASRMVDTGHRWGRAILLYTVYRSTTFWPHGLLGYWQMALHSSGRRHETGRLQNDMKLPNQSTRTTTLFQLTNCTDKFY